jgi:hypothetical protein
MANSSYIKLVTSVMSAMKEDNISSDVAETTVISVLDRVIRAAWDNSDDLKARFKTYDNFRVHVIRTRLVDPDSKPAVTRIKSRYERDPVI